MSEIKVNNGNIEDALKRFKRQCARNGVLQEVRKREHYEKPSVKRKKKIRGSKKKKILITYKIWKFRKVYCVLELPFFVF